MGYPKKYAGHYPNLASWLCSQGHSVYPVEMFCQPVPVKKGPIIHMKHVKDPYTYQQTHYLYGLVDVVSFSGGKLWAWEYKSKGDNVLRAIDQLQNYAHSFDYICLAVQELAHLDRLIKKHGLYVKTIMQNMGAGVYWEGDKGFDEIYSPKLQCPNPKLHDDLVNRFRRYVYSKPTQKIVDQNLTKWTDAVNLA